MEKIKELFRLEKVEDKKVICRGLADRLNRILSDEAHPVTAQLLKQADKQTKNKRKHNKTLYINNPQQLIFTREELNEISSLEGLEMFVYLDAFFRGTSSVDIHFQINFNNRNRNWGSCYFGEVYLGDVKKVKLNEICHATFDCIEVGSDYGSGFSTPHRWARVPIPGFASVPPRFDDSPYSERVDRDKRLRNQYEICTAIDRASVSTLNILEVFEKIQVVEKDPKIIEYSKILDSLTREDFENKLFELFGSSVLGSRFNNIGRYGLDFLKYGNSNKIPELTDIVNCSILTTLIGRFLQNGYERGQQVTEKCWDDISYEAYVSALANLFQVDDEEAQNLITTDNLFGIVIIPKDSFPLFFGLLEKSIKTHFADLREKDRKEFEEKKRRKEEAKKRFEQVKEVISEVATKLDNLDIDDSLSKLGDTPFRQLNWLDIEALINTESSLSEQLAFHLISAYTHRKYLESEGITVNGKCPYPFHRYPMFWGY